MVASDTADDLTIEHYQRPEVKATILKFCNPESGGFRALNGDAGWYITTDDGNVRLRTSEDYDNTTSKYRTTYATLDVMDDEVKKKAEKWDDEKNRPEKPIGTFMSA